MKPNPIHDLACATIGAGALLAYILACAPAFSPDGSKVVFTSISEQPNAVSIMLYDLRSHRLQTVLTQPSGNDKDLAGMMLARWSSDGKRILAIWQGEKQLNVLAVPIEGEGPSQLYKLPKQGSESDGPLTACMLYPPPVIGEHLFVSGLQVCRLNLQTGETILGTGTNGFLLKNWGTNLFYASVGFPAQNVLEIGRLAPDTLALTPIQKFATTLQGAMLDVTADGARCAISGETNGVPHIQIYRGGALLKDIPVTLGTNVVTLGCLRWAADGETLFAAYAGGNSNTCGVLEISTQDNTQRVLPLWHSSKHGDATIPYALGLSPDAETLAVSRGLDAQDGALFLIHLKGRSWLSRWWNGMKPGAQSFFVEGREVTKVSLPNPPQSAKATSARTNATSVKSGGEGVRK